MLSDGDKSLFVLHSRYRPLQGPLKVHKTKKSLKGTQNFDQNEGKFKTKFPPLLDALLRVAEGKSDEFFTRIRRQAL